jgi:hypothetical protein
MLCVAAHGCGVATNPIAPVNAGVARTPGATWKAREGALYDSCGEKVVLRGINHPTLYMPASIRNTALRPRSLATGACVALQLR